jgi:hypothetical protein
LDCGLSPKTRLAQAWAFGLCSKSPSLQPNPTASSQAKASSAASACRIRPYISGDLVTVTLSLLVNAVLAEPDKPLKKISQPEKCSFYYLKNLWRLESTYVAQSLACKEFVEKSASKQF